MIESNSLNCRSNLKWAAFWVKVVFINFGPVCANSSHLAIFSKIEDGKIRHDVHKNLKILSSFKKKLKYTEANP